MADFRFLTAAAFGLGLFACGPAEETRAPTPAAGAPSVETTDPSTERAEARAAFDALVETATTEYFRRSPESATYYGVSADIGGGDYNARWSLTGALGRAEDRAFADSVVARFEATDPDLLDGPRRITREVVLDQFAAALAVADAAGYGNVAPGSYTVIYPITQLSGVHTEMPNLLQSAHPIADDQDAADYVSRLYGFGEVFDGVIENLQTDAAVGAVPPDFVIDGALEVVRTFTAPEVAEHPLYTTFADRLAEADVATPDSYLAQAADALTTDVYPAYGRLRVALETLRRDAPHDAGMWRLPNADAVYQALIRMNGDSAQSAQEIHDAGLAEVDRILAEMDAILVAEGRAEGSVGDRMRALGEEPRFLYPDTDEGKAQLIADLNAQIDAIRPKLPEQFRTIPPQPIEVRRIPEYREASAAGGYASSPSLDGTRPGIYWINLRTTAIWPKWSMPTLTYHEGYPGHLFAGGVARGQADSPLMQRLFASTNAYAEGWALYAEALAEEMGMYAGDPYGDLGRLQAELHRAIRLVTDTGMHALTWSREDALTYMMETEGIPKEDARVEIERYAAWPSQALGYKLGMLKMQALRARAETELGAAFDARGFHDVVLLDGGLPLPVLERKVDAWIEEMRSR